MGDARGGPDHGFRGPPGARSRVRSLRRRRPATHGDRTRHSRFGTRRIPATPRHERDPGAHRAHVEDRKASEELTMKEAVLVSAVRSAVAKGKKDGALASVHPTELSACVMKAAIEKAGVEAGMLDDIYWGCAMPEASQGLNVSRLSSLRAGIPVEVPSATINRFCS